MTKRTKKDHVADFIRLFVKINDLRKGKSSLFDIITEASQFSGGVSNEDLVAGLEEIYEQEKH